MTPIGIPTTPPPLKINWLALLLSLFVTILVTVIKKKCKINEFKDYICNILRLSLVNDVFNIQVFQFETSLKYQVIDTETEGKKRAPYEYDRPIGTFNTCTLHPGLTSPLALTRI